MNYILIILGIINLETFFLYVLDKYFAVKEKWRISEKVLILHALFGGSLGALLGMIVARHKIRKPKFFILVPLFLIIHIAIAVYISIGNFPF